MAPNFIEKMTAAKVALEDLGLEKAHKALAETNLLLKLLQDAGYEVSRLELTMSVPPAIEIFLKTGPTVSQDKLNGFLLEHKEKLVVTTILTALIQANKMRSAVDVETLVLKGTRILLTASPNISLIWERET